MRPIHLKITACAVLTGACFAIRGLMIETTGSHGNTAGGKYAEMTESDHVFLSAIRHPRSIRRTNVATRSHGITAIKGRYGQTNVVETVPTPHQSKPDEAEVHKVSDSGSPNQHKRRLPAVQLAGNAKFPAVFMARVLPVADGDDAVNPAVKAAHEAISGKFYQDLAVNSTPVDPADDDGTVVIGSGPVLEGASAHADEQFRSLFGNEAYNRHAMDSAREVMLSPDSGTSGN